MNAWGLLGLSGRGAALILASTACGGQTGTDSGGESTGGGAGASTTDAGGSTSSSGAGLGGIVGTGVGGTQATGGASSLPSRCYDERRAADCVDDTAVTGYFYEAESGQCVHLDGTSCQASDVFESQASCELNCGVTGSSTSCPLRTYDAVGALDGRVCSSEGARCAYGADSCLCQSVGEYDCEISDSRCATAAAIEPADCDGDICTVSDAIVLIGIETCECALGVWACVHSYY